MDATHTAPVSEAQSETVALFISDLHLQAEMPETAQAFFDFLHTHANHTQQLYLLGDIFEYWAGDDDLTPFNQQVIAELRAVSNSGVKTFWIAGNRDFLAGAAFAEACNITLLPDPFVISIAGKQIVLTHGDALCTDDTSYMAFRAQVRQGEWQREFLARPLEQRKAIIAGLRQGSRDAQKQKADYIMDANPQAIEALFATSGTSTMIHGHTHRPALHTAVHNDSNHLRYVLPDWDCDGDENGDGGSEHKRGGWIAIDAYGNITRHDVDGSVIQTAS
jgi:UDP-2,3-diacylglucosamine hydrolase